MVNTPSTPGPFDPLQDADPDVPFFPLMGTDFLAPELVEEWADRTRRHARGIENEGDRRRLLAKALEAEEIAWAMRRYLKTGESEDVRARPTRASYNDTPAADDHLWKAGVIAAAQALRDAAYHFTEAAAHLPGDQAEALHKAVETINGIAETYSPKRASYPDTPDFPVKTVEIADA